MKEGDTVELLKVGCAGWWFVKVLGMVKLKLRNLIKFSQKFPFHLDFNVEGWAPAAYLEPINKTLFKLHN